MASEKFQKSRRDDILVEMKEEISPNPVPLKDGIRNVSDRGEICIGR